MDHKLPTYQQVLWDKVRAGGFKHGELSIISAGRRTGKSRLNQYLQQYMKWMPEADTPKYEVADRAIVDDRPWYTVFCNKVVADWIRQQPDKECHQHNSISVEWTVYNDVFDIPEELYMMLVLKFGK